MHAIATCKDANQGLSWEFETAGAIPSLLCRLQILVGWELEQSTYSDCCSYCLRAPAMN